MSFSTKFIVIEGSDGSGKTTQAKALLDAFNKENGPKFATLLDFPDYQSSTGKLISSMLSGEFGTDAKDLNSYFTSPMYSIDRYRYYREYTKKGEYYSVAISNRYTMSNLIHQGARIKDRDKLIEYWHWLYDFEFNKLGLPKPDDVIFLYIPWEVSLENIQKRNAMEGKPIDINEAADYLQLVDDNIHRIIEITGWKLIHCYDGWNGKMDPQDDITNNIISYLAETDDDYKSWLFNTYKNINNK